MHFQSFLALALLASPFAQATRRGPVDESVVSSSLFERYVASHLKTRKYESPELQAKPAVFRPRKIEPPVVVAPKVVPRAPTPFVRPPGSHLAHAIWKPYTPNSNLIVASATKEKAKRRVPSQNKKDRIHYRSAYLDSVLARDEKKRRGLHILNHAAKIEQRSAKLRPASSKPTAETWTPVPLPDGEEDWSWMNAESAEGDDETGGNLRRRAGQSAVEKMEQRMRRGTSL